MAATRPDPLDDLYAAPPRDFIARRKAIAARLREQGDADAAKAVAAVAKPKATVWAINHVARASPKAVKRLVTAFDAVKAAQVRAPAKMASATGDLREATEAVVHDAIAAMTDAGLGTTLDTHRRIANTLRGAAATARDALLEGRLSDEVTPAGFELFAGTTPRGRAHPPARKEASARDAAPAARAAAPVPPPRDDLARRRAEKLEEEAREHERASQSASAAVHEARKRLRELQARARAATRTATKTRGLANRAAARVPKKPRRSR